MLIWSLIGNSNQDYEPLEKIAYNDPYYGLPKELCTEIFNQIVGPLLFPPMKPVSSLYKVRNGERDFDQVLNSSSEVIVSDLSFDELREHTWNKMIQEW